MSKKITLVVIVLIGLSALVAGSYYLFFVPPKNEAISATVITPPPSAADQSKSIHKPANDPNAFGGFTVTPMDNTPLPQVGSKP
jgi:hypothetical protein